MIVRLAVNGSPLEIDVEPRTLLVAALRNGLGLTGTKVGCDTSQCGACLVLVDGQTTKSCTMLAVQAAGRDVVTVEGLPDPAETVREALHQEHGLQCGYCTSGMVVTMTSLLSSNPSPTEDEINDCLDGNLCRCTGYVGIKRAVRWAALALAGEAPEPVAGTELESPVSVTAGGDATDADTGFEVV